MKLTVLGSGTVLSGANRATSGFVLDIGSEKLIVDLGFGCFKNLQKAGFDYTKLNNLFFTHFEHPDHINDLSAFLFARKISVLLKLSSSQQVNLFAGPGFGQFIKNLLAAYPVLKNTLFKLKFSELDAFSTQKFNNLTLITKPMNHVASSLGLRFEVAGKTIVFSGDTAYNENLVELAKGTDLLVVECSFAGKGRPDHLSTKKIADIASRTKAKAVLLTHFYPDAEKSDLKKPISKGFKGKIHIAKDFMQVNI